MLFHRRIALFLFLLGFIPSALAITPSEVAERINLAGKQRLLTQKMSKEMLLIIRGIDVEKNRTQLNRTSKLFDLTLRGLEFGENSLGLRGTNNKSIIKQLKKIGQHWIGFEQTVTSVLQGKISKKIQSKIARENLPLLQSMNEAVLLFEQEADQLASSKIAKTINMAGRQRMLTQKIAKEVLLVSLEIETERNITNLKQSTKLFENNLKSLMQGDPKLGIIKSNYIPIKIQLEMVSRLWRPYKFAINKILTLHKQNRLNEMPMDKLVYIKFNMPILNAMDKAVSMYVKRVK